MTLDLRWYAPIFGMPFIFCGEKRNKKIGTESGESVFKLLYRFASKKFNTIKEINF